MGWTPEPLDEVPPELDVLKRDSGLVSWRWIEELARSATHLLVRLLEEPLLEELLPDLLEPDDEPDLYELLDFLVRPPLLRPPPLLPPPRPPPPPPPRRLNRSFWGVTSTRSTCRGVLMIEAALEPTSERAKSAMSNLMVVSGCGCGGRKVVERWEERVVSWRPKSDPKQRCACTDTVQRRELDNKRGKKLLFVDSGCCNANSDEVGERLLSCEGAVNGCLWFADRGFVTGGRAGPEFYKDESNLARRSQMRAGANVK